MFNVMVDFGTDIIKAMVALCLIMLFVIMYQNAKESKRGGDRISFRVSCVFMGIAGLSLLCVLFC